MNVNEARWGRIWFGSVVGWSLFAVLFFTQEVLFTAVNNPGGVDWPTRIKWNLGWLVWGLLTPLVITVADRFPVFEEGKRRRTVAFHAWAALAIALLQITCEALIVFSVNAGLGLSVPFTRVLWGTGMMRIHIDLLIYAAITATMVAFRLRRETSELQLRTSQLETHLAQARLAVLKAQLQPHFLFNTMHTIGALVMKHENEKAVQMLTRLSDFLRMTLDGGDIQEVPLRKEVELLEIYLQIQQIRFGRRLAVSLDIPSDTLPARVPYLLLQPLVENAVKHGLERHSDAGRIQIRASRNRGRVLLQIADDGPGLPSEGKGGFREGTGIRNTRRRLQELYGDRGSLRISPGENGRGVVVEVELPFRVVAEEVLTYA